MIYLTIKHADGAEFCQNIETIDPAEVDRLKDAPGVVEVKVRSNNK